MKVLDKGHRYAVSSLDGDHLQEIVFVKRFRGTANHPGTTNQEVLRVLIDRIETLDAEKPYPANVDILKNLRMALVLQECRALARKVEKGELKPENVEVSGRDGHFKLLT